MTFPGLEKEKEFHDFSRFSMTGYTLGLVLFCCNMDGHDKYPLLCVGKSEKTKVL